MTMNILEHIDNSSVKNEREMNHLVDYTRCRATLRNSGTFPHPHLKEVRKLPVVRKMRALSMTDESESSSASSNDRNGSSSRLSFSSALTEASISRAEDITENDQSDISFSFPGHTSVGEKKPRHERRISREYLKHLPPRDECELSVLFCQKSPITFKSCVAGNRTDELLLKRLYLNLENDSRAENSCALNTLEKFRHGNLKNVGDSCVNVKANNSSNGRTDELALKQIFEEIYFRAGSEKL